VSGAGEKSNRGIIAAAVLVPLFGLALIALGVAFIVSSRKRKLKQAQGHQNLEDNEAANADKGTNDNANANANANGEAAQPGMKAKVGVMLAAASAGVAGAWNRVRNAAPSRGRRDSSVDLVHNGSGNSGAYSPQQSGTHDSVISELKQNQSRKNSKATPRDSNNSIDVDDEEPLENRKVQFDENSMKRWGTLRSIGKKTNDPKGDNGNNKINFEPT